MESSVGITNPPIGNPNPSIAAELTPMQGFIERIVDNTQRIQTANNNLTRNLDRLIGYVPEPEPELSVDSKSLSVEYARMNLILDDLSLALSTLELTVQTTNQL